MSHVDALVTDDDPNGMELQAYLTYIPLYILADFLRLHSLCRELTTRLHRTNRIIAAHIQRLAAQSPDGDLVLEQNFINNFTECAKLAYSIPEPRKSAEDEIGSATPSGIRFVFVELFEFVRYKPLDQTLIPLTSKAPLLLVDVMHSMRLVEDAKRHVRSSFDFGSTLETCRDCGIDPIRGTGGILREVTGPGKSRLAAGENGSTNFWVRHDLCFECSVYYSREEFLYGPRAMALRKSAVEEEE